MQFATVGLSNFISQNEEAILAECEAFARTLLPGAADMDQEALRDHLAHILTAVAADMKRPQTADEQSEKSKGRAPSERNAPDTAAETHGGLRAASRFNVSQTAAEFRALRASVLRLWLATSPSLGPPEVDEITRFNEAMDQALAESLASFAEAAARDRNLFLGVLSHELRTPLGTIVGSAYTLLRAAEQGRTFPEAASRALSAGKRIQSILDDLLDYVRSGLNGGMRVTPIPLRMDDLCERLLGELDVGFPGRRVELEVEGDMAGVWDEQRIGQAISNIVSNAIKYGSPEVPVRVHLDGSGDDEVNVAVHNAGPQIPAEIQESFFQPLVRGAGPDQSGVSLGLGLYIVRQIAEAHDGTVEATSSAHNGTVFRIRLPRQSDAAHPSAFGSLGAS